MNVMCGWVWCEDVVSYHERGRLRPEGVGVIAHMYITGRGLEPQRIPSRSDLAQLAAGPDTTIRHGPPRPVTELSADSP